MLSGLRRGVKSTTKLSCVRRRRAAQLLAALVVIGVLASVSWVGTAILEVAPRTSATDVIAFFHAPDPKPGSIAWKINNNDRVNLLLLARGGAGNDNPNYTDTMVVLSLRPLTHRATAISLPRYMWVEIPASSSGALPGKLYSAYALGASQNAGFLRPQWRTSTGQGDLASATVELTIAQPIDGWIAVDANAFEAMIDGIGGIRVTIPEALDDTSYPSDVDDQTTHIHFDSGTQTLNGLRALEYARSRLSTSEADRSRRQEIILLGMLKSLKNTGFKPSLIAAAGPIKDGLRTNLAPLDARELFPLVSAIRQQDLNRIVLQDSPLLVEKALDPNQSVLVPRDSRSGYAELQAYVASELP